MEIPFQLIFSLILIAAFIYAAGVGIKYFLNTADLTKINKFIVDFDSDVEKTWADISESTQTYEYSLPGRIKYVCFSPANNLTKMSLNSANISACSDFEAYISSFKNMNMFFCPAGGAWQIKAPIYANINCKNKDCLEFPKSPYCIENSGGKIRITLIKEYGAGKIQLK
jgi:hypothetical protein